MKSLFKLRIALAFSLLAAAAPAQLTTDQRLADFRSLADLYARRYAPIQWKLAALKFDLLDIGPWQSRVNSVATDLDFYDLLVEFVSDLQDAHDQYQLPSDFEAHLGFTADIYDGRVLIDSIDRTILAADSYPFQIGDELVSVDGKSSADWIKALTKYAAGGNSRTEQRLAAGSITDRFQAIYPYAHQIGDSAAVTILRQSGDTEQYMIPWNKLGTPLTGLGPSAGPRIGPGKQPSSARRRARVRVPAGTAPFYQQYLDQYRNYLLPGRINVVGFDELRPVFSLPDSFVQRLGTRRFDSYFSGTYTAADGTRIGYLRIPDFLFPSLKDLDAEIAFFQTHTDVLVVDIMRNPGGFVCSAEDILSRLTPSGFTGAAAEIRPDWTDVVSINSALADAQAQGADADTISQLQLYQAEFQKAFQQGGNTASLPLCGSTLARSPAAATYAMPVLLLVDEMSASSADIFAGLAQDNHAASLFGYRTMGAGGSPEQTDVGVNTEGATSVTRSMAVRLQPLVTPDYPTTRYIENVGVRPDSTSDYMTADNLLNGGSTFVAAFTDAAVRLVKGGN